MSRLAAPAPVGVVGAGTMGAGIAQVAAVAGHPVLLLDSGPGRAEAAVGRVHAALDRLVTRGRLDRQVASAARDRLGVASSVADLAGSALVVEAVVEVLPVKQELLASLEDVVGHDCVLATNTSSLSVTDVADGMRHPGRFLGLHFFNPAPVMRLVEVVSGARTDPDVADGATELMAAWGKTPVRVRSAPGFVVNRVARPFYGEAMRLLEAGVDAATLDAVLRGSGGFPMGPLELSDLIGQDVNLATTTSVWEQTGRNPRFAPTEAQTALVDEGLLGRKTGRGFYDHDAAAPTPLPAPAPPGAQPQEVRVLGDWGPWEPLWDRVRRGGVTVVRDDASGEPRAELPAGPHSGVLVPTDGRTATARAARTGTPTVVLDLARDPATAERWAVAASDACPPDVVDRAVGLLRSTGADVSVLPDVPGLLVARTAALLVDEACDAVARGVASAADVDTAMRLGAGHPCGPLEWGERLGLRRVAALLDALASTDARFRVSPALRDAAGTGRPLHEL